jgi:hypothetical protein
MSFLNFENYLRFVLCFLELYINTPDFMDRLFRSVPRSGEGPLLLSCFY